MVDPIVVEADMTVDIDGADSAWMQAAGRHIPRLVTAGHCSTRLDWVVDVSVWTVPRMNREPPNWE